MGIRIVDRQYKSIFVLFLMILVGSLQAQELELQIDDRFNLERADSLGVVTIVRDAKLDELLEADREINSKNPGFTGYRIQIFSGRSTDRERAFETKERFKELFPGEKAYVVYKAPDFRVRVGNFRSKLESIELYKACLKHFPNCYPVKTRISFSDLDSEIEETSEDVLYDEDLN